MSIAEKLREAAAKKALCGNVDRIALALTDVPARCDGLCGDCTETWYKKLANAIEAELKASKPSQLPEGIEWPRFEDGELVRFGDRFVDRDGVAKKVTDVHFYEDKVFVGPCDRYKYGEPVKRPEREVLDADGVPIKVGDTVYYTQPSAYTEGERIVDTIVGKEVCFTNGYWADPACLTHRKPDTQEAIDEDMALGSYDYLKKHGLILVKAEGETKKEFKQRIRIAHRQHILERQRKLLGGGQ